MRELLETLLADDGPLLSLLRPGLVGLTDAEYLWEPVPDCWSIRRGEGEGDDRGDAGTWTVEITYPDPVPSPFTTIAWRMAHLTGSTLVAAAALRGTCLPNGHLDERWGDLDAIPGTAAGAVDRLERAVSRVKDLLASASDDDLVREHSHEWAGTHTTPVWRDVEYFAHFEPASHAAEVRLLRDLYRHTDGGKRGLQLA